MLTNFAAFLRNAADEWHLEDLSRATSVEITPGLLVVSMLVDYVSNLSKQTG
jgi:hypothetical protein